MTYERPERRKERKNSFRDGDASDEESKVLRKQRNSSIMRLNKKQNPSQMGEHLELEEESGVSRESRKSKILKPRAVKGALLNIEANSEVSEELDEIKF